MITSRLTRTLDNISRDPALRRQLDMAEKLLPRHGTSVQAGGGAEYAEQLKRILRLFSEEHLKPYLRSVLGEESSPARNVCTSLSYTSRLVRNPSPRVTDYRTVEVLASAPGELSAHLDDVLDRLWVRQLSRDPKRVELNELAQRATCIGDDLYVRQPIFVSLTPEASADPRHLQIPAKGSVDKAADRLSEFLLRHRALQSAKQPRYPNDATSIRRTSLTEYVSYLRQLLAWRDKTLSLTTIALSDELTDVPLGSVMIFSDAPFEPDIATEIHHLCFYIVNAIYKWEGALLERRAVGELLLGWFRHETVHWIRATGFVAERLLQDATTDIRQAVQDIQDVATVAQATVDLIGNPNDEFPSPDELKEALAALRRFHKKTTSLTLEVGFDSRFPAILRSVCMELVQNALKYGADAIVVRLDQLRDHWDLRVTSWPHVKKDVDNVMALTRGDHSPEVKFKGIRLILAAAQAFNGAAEWSFMAKGAAFELIARFRLPRAVNGAGGDS